LTNPAFDSGETGWTISVAGGFPLVYAADGGGQPGTPAIAAQSAPNLAWFGGYNNADDVASQAVTIPAGATSITVGFFYAIFTRETSGAENDVMNVQLVTDTQTIALAHLSDNAPVSTWTHFSATLPTTLAGQMVTLHFEDTSNGSQITSFYIDSVSLSVVSCP
jgi:hypothetical protein